MKKFKPVDLLVILITGLVITWFINWIIKMFY